MRNKKIFIVYILSVLIIIVFIFFFISSSKMDASHTQVKNHLLNQLQQSIDNNEDGISYRTDKYQLNGEQYIGRIYIVNNKDDIRYVKDILSRCKALKEVKNYKPTDIRVIVSDIDIGYTGAKGDFFWSIEDGKSLGFYLSEAYSNKLWKFLDSLDYVGN